MSGDAEKAALAAEVEAAMQEAVKAYNAAKRDDAPNVTISRRALYLLFIGAAQGYGAADHVQLINRSRQERWVSGT